MSGFQKNWEISLKAEQLLASQEGLLHGDEI
jgi:hypothetical protein